MLGRKVHLKQDTFFKKNYLRSYFIFFRIQKCEDLSCLQKKEFIYDIFLSLRNLRKAVILWCGMICHGMAATDMLLKILQWRSKKLFVK